MFALEDVVERGAAAAARAAFDRSRAEKPVMSIATEIAPDFWLFVTQAGNSDRPLAL
jgi:hypothetical protein